LSWNIDALRGLHSGDIAAAMRMPTKIMCHSRYVLDRALSLGWEAGARYTNLRDIKHLNRFHFLDIDWQNYDYDRHLWSARLWQPAMTVARDVEDSTQLDAILREAQALKAYCQTVIVVPKDPVLQDCGRLGVPETFRLGYSVPTKYGKTAIPPAYFKGEVHLLGGRPDVQRALAQSMDVRSLDGNRITYDAKFGDYFDGTAFKPHPVGGYEACLLDSLRNVNRLWEGS
jgi:hypothetical protein